MANITAPLLLIRPKATDRTLQFYWYPPTTIGTGASFISTYTITLTDASGGIPPLSTLTVNTPFATYAGYTTAILSSMTNGIKYTYGITAQNDLGFSSPTTLFRRVAPGFKPQPVVSVGAYPQSATSALVAWVSSGVVATPPIEWFVAKAISSNGADPILARSQYPFMSNVLISSLNTASQYRFYVYAVNDPGYSIPVFTPYLAIPAVNSSDLIVYLSAESYPGYGQWLDRSGNGYNAVIENGTAALNAAGNGLVLNGSTNWRFPPTGPRGIGSYSTFTLQTWFKQMGDPVGPDSGAGASVVTETYTGNTVNMAITTSYSNDLQTRGGTFYNGAWTFGPNFALTNNEWHNLAITYNGSQLISYKDGNAIGTVSGSDAGSLYNNYYRIGRRWDIDALEDYIVGDIGQVLIYGRALSGAEILQNVSSYAYKYTVPAAPTSVAGTHGNTEVAITWIIPSSNSGATIDYYTAMANTGSVSTYQSTLGSMISSYTYTGLTNGTPYTFQVSAHNLNGNSAFSAASSAVTPSTTPNAPTNLQGTFGDAQVALTWSAPSNTGGAAISSYTVAYTTDNVVSTLFSPSFTTTSGTVTGLTNHISTFFFVYGTNLNGNSPYSAQTSSITPLMTWNPAMKGTDVVISQNGTQLSQQFGYRQSALGKHLVTSGEKVMYSVEIKEVGEAQTMTLGWGTSTMQYNGNTNAYDGYPGTDNQSLGVDFYGAFYYSSTIQQTGLPLYSTIGDVVDIALHDGVGWWIRVNNNDWNNDPTANPTTGAGALFVSSLTNLYPAGNPAGGGRAEGAFQLISRASSNIPSGYTFL